MTITKITLVSEEGGIGSDGCQYTQLWHVYFTGVYDCSAITYATFTGGGLTLPKHLDTHASDAAAYCSDVKVQRAGDSDVLGTTDVPGVAEYTATFAQKTLSYDPNPLSRPPIIRGVGGLGLTEVPIKDVDGKPMVNSTGELYDGLPPRPVRGERFTITRNEGTNPATNAAAYSNTSNNAIWNGVAIGNATIGEIEFEKKQEVISGSVVTYWEVTYPISCRRDGWKLKPIDSGWKYLNTSGVPVDFVDSTNNKPSMPVLLNGSGGLLNGTGYYQTSGATPVIYPTAGYKVVEEADWSTLALPNPFA
jgi:hypothetical protein